MICMYVFIRFNMDTPECMHLSLSVRLCLPLHTHTHIVWPLPGFETRLFVLEL
jgi:hypothetical protein